MTKGDMMHNRMLFSLLLLLFVTNNVVANAENAGEHSSRVVKDVKAEGSCAVVGMSAEQSQLIALQRARAAAIEQASGVRITSGTVVTNGRLAVDFIRTYSKGFIVNEKVEWLPLGQYQKDGSTAPIPEFRVNILADVYRPEKKIRPIGLYARLNTVNFRAGEKASISIKAEREAKIAIFNITADDKVVMLFPNHYDKENIISGDKGFKFPAEGSEIELMMRTLPGHQRDAEAFFVVAMDMGGERMFGKMFTALEPLSFSSFFKRYSEIADHSEDVLLTYEVTAVTASGP